MLSVPGLFPGDVPIRHPAELLPFNALQHDQEGVQRHLLFLFSHERKTDRLYFDDRPVTLLPQPKLKNKNGILHSSDRKEAERRSPAS